MSEHVHVQAGLAERLSEFMAARAREVYAEPETELHTRLTERAMERLFDIIGTTCSNIRILKALDVGCGQGPALYLFTKKTIEATGISLSAEDVRECCNRGLIALLGDQNDIKCCDGIYDLVWARHVLEHSVAPLWTLTEFARVLKPGGWLYAEMPAPDTNCFHEANGNHYSVLGQRAWHFLMEKAGFEIVEAWEQPIKVRAGDDLYFCFVCRRK